MRRHSGTQALALLLATSATLVAWRAAAEPPASPNDRLAIERTVRDYIDGWYEGNAERMTRALHPDLVKRAPVPLPGGRSVLDTTSASAMIEMTAAGFGKPKTGKAPQTEVVVLDVVGDLASAKSVSPDYIDLIHVLRINGDWRIVNVLWKPLRAPAQAK